MSSDTNSAAGRGSYIGSASSTRDPWLIVACALVGTAVGGSTVHYGLSVIMKSLGQDLGLSRGGASSVISLFFLGVGVGTPVAGFLIDRLGPRAATIGAAMLLGGSLCAMAASSSLTAIRGLALLTGFSGAATTTLPYLVAIGSRFERRRGLALGIAATGPRLGNVMLPLIASWTLIRYDWRMSLAVIGVLAMMLAIPAAMTGLGQSTGHGRDAVRPGRGSAPVAATAAVPPAWRTTPFYLILAGIAMTSMAGGSAIVQAVPFLTDRGFAASTAAATVASAGLAGIAGRLGSGYLMDRLPATYVSAAFYALIGVGLMLVLSTASFWPAALGYDLIGLALGSESNVAGYLTSRYFPRFQHGRTMGILIGVFVLADAIGVAALGYSFDLLGSYRPGLIVAAVLGPAGGLVILQLRRYAYVDEAPAGRHGA